MIGRDLAFSWGFGWDLGLLYPGLDSTLGMSSHDVNSAVEQALRAFGGQAGTGEQSALPLPAPRAPTAKPPSLLKPKLEADDSKPGLSSSTTGALVVYQSE